MTTPDQHPPTRLPDNARSLTPLVDLLESFEDQATIYVRGIVWTRFEATWVRVFRAPRAQYADAFHVQFKPRGQPQIRQLVEDYEPSAIIVAGWNHPDADPRPSMLKLYPDQPQLAPAGTSVRDMDVILDRYVRSLPAAKVILDLRGKVVATKSKVATKSEVIMEPPAQLPALIEPAALPTPAPADTYIVPSLIADLGDQAGWRYVEFFTANINNDHTRRAYARACSRFFAWCENRGLSLTAIRSFDVAAWVKELQEKYGAPAVKQQLAAVRMLFDWLITGQIVPINPAAAVRGPKHVVKTGKTPVLEGEEWLRLLASIPTTTLRDLRDRALIATLTYSFARITAALKMKVEDLQARGAGWTVRLHEKGGKEHAMPCHHALAEALRAYIDAAGIAEDRKGWLFRTAPRHNADALSDRPMNQYAAWLMIRRRAAAAGIAAPIGCHTFRATGITAYLANGGALEHAQEMAAHESPRTTKLYDRRKERLTQDEIERIRFSAT